MSLCLRKLCGFYAEIFLRKKDAYAQAFNAPRAPSNLRCRRTLALTALPPCCGLLWSLTRKRPSSRLTVAVRTPVSRAAFLRKLEEVAPALLPFVRGFYARQSVYLWWDSPGVCHRILQGEGCEQGDPLAPALYALAQHDGLAAASQGLRSGDRLAAFLDDLYVSTTASRARDSIDAITGAVEEYAGVSSNLGKTRVYSRAGGPPPPGIAELSVASSLWVCPSAARSSSRDALVSGSLTNGACLLNSRSFLISSPRGFCSCSAPRFVRSTSSARFRLLSRRLLLRPTTTWDTQQTLLGEPGADWPHARACAFLLARMGGLGLLCAERTAPSAYWGSWADCLPVMAQRRPEAAERCVRELMVGDEAAAPCLREAAACGDLLRLRGWDACPS